MRVYEFAIHQQGGKIEPLGVMALKDDAEALAFAAQVTRELTEENAAQYAGWTMDITAGMRAVGSIEFDPAQ